ncbi:MAG: ATP-binding protein [Azospirillaceae bacterium]|nr:ATP-binding protein [Azospirillaceae bacterium]
MKFGIGPRLFLTVLLFLAVLGAAAVVTTRWSLLTGGAASSRVPEPGSRELIRALETSYIGHGSWAFLPNDPQERRGWLRARRIETVGAGDPGRFARTSGTFGDRIALVDADGHILSGVMPGRIIRAIGSIDTRSLPVIVDGRAVGHLVVAGADDADDTLAVAFLLQKSGRLGAIAGGALLLAIVLAVLLAAHFRRPIGKLVEGARMLESGRFDARMDDSRRDELGELARTFNHMAARLEQAELARRQWVADTSHELRTPLAVLRAQIESLEDGIRLSTPENLRMMLTHVESMTRRVDDLYALAQADRAQLRYEKHPADLWPVIRSVADSFRDRAAVAAQTITIDAPPPQSTVICDADRMRQVFVNLFENAVRYTDAGGHIQVSGWVEGGSLLVTIDDSAPGVPQSSLGRLGERFFRTEQARAGRHGGAGLGLALARQIVDAHAGGIGFAASPLGGLQARISLPLVHQ